MTIRPAPIWSPGEVSASTPDSEQKGNFTWSYDHLALDRWDIHCDLFGRRGKASYVMTLCGTEEQMERLVALLNDLKLEVQR